MHYLNSKTLSILFAGLFVSQWACADEAIINVSDSKQKEQVSSVITKHTDATPLSNQLMAELMKTDEVNSDKISIHSYQHNVQICGDVADDLTREKIRSVVAGTSEVHKYFDDVLLENSFKHSMRVHLKPVKNKSLPDERLTKKVIKGLTATLGQDDLKGISIHTRDGVVTLCGFVGDRKTIARMKHVAQSTTGVKRVINNLINKELFLLNG